MIYYLIASILIAVAALFARTKRAVLAAGILFYAVQIAAAGLLLWGGLYDTTSAAFFTFDALGTLFYLLLVVVSMYVFGHSEAYLQGEDLRSYRLYFALLMLLTTAIAGAYFANNLAVTWIFLEATTLCSAGIIYHRRTAQALEAAWKYVFVCSTGIAMAYLGILLLAAATKCETLSYEAVTEAASSGNPLYLKTAFLLILCGYSCKLELFPLYTVGIDANFAAPAPASALISTGLVNAGFLALLRVYKLLAGTEVFPWVRSVLLIVGILSLGVGALFLRRTNNYKRFLSYSTVENMGIAAIGLGIGGIGVWAALFHVFCHTLVKSSLFLQMAVVRQVYDSYRINRIGDYIHINRVGAVGLLTGMVVLLAFPPSPLFVSELMILKQVITDRNWWLVAGLLLLMCIVIYSFGSRLSRLCYQPNQDRLHPSKAHKALSWSALSLLRRTAVGNSRSVVRRILRRSGRQAGRRALPYSPLFRPAARRPAPVLLPAARRRGGQGADRVARHGVLRRAGTPLAHGPAPAGASVRARHRRTLRCAFRRHAVAQAAAFSVRPVRPRQYDGQLPLLHDGGPFAA